MTPSQLWFGPYELDATQIHCEDVVEIMMALIPSSCQFNDFEM